MSCGSMRARDLHRSVRQVEQEGPPLSHPTLFLLSNGRAPLWPEMSGGHADSITSPPFRSHPCGPLIFPTICIAAAPGSLRTRSTAFYWGTYDSVYPSNQLGGCFHAIQTDHPRRQGGSGPLRAGDTVLLSPARSTPPVTPHTSG